MIELFATLIVNWLHFNQFAIKVATAPSSVFIQFRRLNGLDRLSTFVTVLHLELPEFPKFSFLAVRINGWEYAYVLYIFLFFYIKYIVLFILYNHSLGVLERLIYDIIFVEKLKAEYSFS